MLNLSVLVTCFNKEKYLDECINSITRQTKEPKEIVVVHDGCDNPMAHSKAETIILRENRGVVTARHEAFRFSTGALVLFVDADDVLSPDYLEKMTLVLAKGADVVYPDLYHWSEKDKKLVVLPRRITPAFVADRNKVVIPVTCLIKRELYEKIGGFREWPVLEDLDFWVRAMCNGCIFRKAETLLWYRRYPGTRNTLDIAKRKEVLKQIMSQFIVTKEKISYVKN